MDAASNHRARTIRRVHFVLMIVWLAMVPIAIITGWVGSLVFISACSLYANAAAHFAGVAGAEPPDDA